MCWPAACAMLLGSELDGGGLRVLCNHEWRVAVQTFMRSLLAHGACMRWWCTVKHQCAVQWCGACPPQCKSFCNTPPPLELNLRSGAMADDCPNSPTAHEAAATGPNIHSMICDKVAAAFAVAIPGPSQPLPSVAGELRRELGGPVWRGGCHSCRR